MSLATLSDIHTAVSAAVARGTTYDATVKLAVRSAANWIEKEHTFAYMHKVAEYTTDPDSSEPRLITFPATIIPAYLIKEITLIRYLHPTTNEWIPVERGEAREVWDNDADYPTRWWLRGLDTIVLDRVTATALELEIHLSMYSDWQKDDDNYTHWLISNAGAFLEAKALSKMGMYVSSPQMLQFYKQEALDELHSVFRADDKLQDVGRGGQARIPLQMME